MARNDLKVGDRVAVYGPRLCPAKNIWEAGVGARIVGTIDQIHQGFIVRIEHERRLYDVDIHQCRRINRKFRKEFWIAQHQCSRPTVHAQKMEDMICGSGCKIEWIRVREVIDAQKI